MRERERLDDFQGGAVACRGCKRLLLFDLAAMAPMRCCTFAYVPSQRQIDLVIYDKLAPGEYEDVPSRTPVPVVIAASAYDERMGESDDPYLVDEEEALDEQVDVLAVTAEQVEERKAERLAQLKRRGQ